jgi:hypothetical protein
MGYTDGARAMAMMWRVRVWHMVCSCSAFADTCVPVLYRGVDILQQWNL